MNNIKSRDFDVTVMYLLLLLEDLEIDILYKQVMNIESNDGRFSKILTILKNLSHLDISFNIKTYIPNQSKN